MANSSEAYDFSLFEDRVDNTAPAIDPKRREQPKRVERPDNIVELPERELKRNARPKRHPIRAMAAALCFSVILATVVSMVYGQVQLTELTEQLNTTTAALAEAESLEVQLSMQATEKMNGSQVEDYAKNTLGMAKISEGQVQYVNVTQADKGTVVEEIEGGAGLIDTILNTLRSWFS